MSDPHTSPPATLRCLGAFEVDLDGRAVTAFPTDKIRALLAYLALEAAQPHRRETLAALLWPEMAGPVALTNLRLALHRLRQTLEGANPGLGEQLLISSRQTLQLNQAAVTTDVSTFQALLATCNTHAHRDLHTCSECLPRLAQAVDLYRGELLAGFALADAPAFEEWLLLRRESLHQQALAALDRLIFAHQQRGEDQQAHLYASRQLTLDSSREQAHRQLMRILARLGLRDEALAQFETCRRLLQAELGVEPDVETVALMEQIQSGEFGIRSAEFRVQRIPYSEFRTPHWGDVPEIAKLYGRRVELARLEHWLVHEHCRLVVLLGLGGVGKTTLAAATVRAVGTHFERVIWRSLLNAPPPDELVRDLVQSLSIQRLTTLPTSLDAQLTLLLDLLRQQRSLLILDNLESILRADDAGAYRDGYAAYGQLIQHVVERKHQSCLLFTSRERPKPIEQWEEDTPLVRTLPLEGLDAAAGQAMLTARGLARQGTAAGALVDRYSGNPLALKLVAQTVHELFAGDVAAFLATEAPIFDDIRTVLDQQFARLSPLEQELLLWLAIEREPTPLQTLRDNLVNPGPPRALIEALRSLQRRSLVSQTTQGFLLQNVIIEYLTDYWVEQVCQEIGDDWVTRWQSEGVMVQSSHPLTPSPLHPVTLSRLNRYALLKATAKEYVRASQERLIVQPILKQLTAKLGRDALVATIRRYIATLRKIAPIKPGYAAGNLLNLLLQLDVDVRGYDFSQLHIRQVNLQKQRLPQVNFQGAHLSQVSFTHLFGEIFAIQFDANGQVLVAGSVGGKLYVWGDQNRPEERRLLYEYESFGAGAEIASFGLQGRLLASGHTDHHVRLWDVTHGQLLRPLAEPIETVWCLHFSADGSTLAVGSADGRVRLWDVQSGQLQQVLHGHYAAVPSLAFTPDGQTLATGDVDGGMCIWRITSRTQARLAHTFHEHGDEVHSLAFDASGTILVSGSHDRTLRLWRILPGQKSVESLHTLQAHTQAIRALAISPDGATIASGGGDTYVRLWDVQTGQLRHTFFDLDYSSAYLAFSAEGRRLASAAREQIVFLWDVATRQRLDALHAHSNQLRAVDFSAEGRWLVSGGDDGMVHLWDFQSVLNKVADATNRGGQAVAAWTLPGHPRSIQDVVFRPPLEDGRTLVASASSDQTIRLWDADSGRVLDTLYGHTDNVEAIRFSGEGRRLVSASRDKTVKLWDLAPLFEANGQRARLMYTLSGHADRVHSCAFSPSGQLVASGSIDRTVRLWDAHNGQPVRTLHGHTNAVRHVAFSPDGRLILSSSYDHTLRLWETQSGALLYTLPTWGTAVLSIAFHPHADLLAFAMNDHSVCLWEPGCPYGTGTQLVTLSGHAGSVNGVQFSPDGQWLVSASIDETIKLWAVATPLEATACRQTLRAEGPYAGMNITGVTGISEAQKATLKALGAVEG